ncbi:hypothetical protein TVAG_362860 [Trichomonas vaginalis G3]|uniref:Leucine Rich Repeat family protein n=1 Tax=Trichomonas vaginalis (strain ATCC PRA-98 / G3) TaxID=412133 RepID=A2E663_TRIV3|nr:hypothetical protein TVAG_362860 [Trichomonas vaginalis G3]|eukprot:XP_001324128.1 hypothetical protein [Trichomonas vaginalis G3]
MKNIDTKPNFDAHLSESEMKMAEKLVPLHQAKIHIAIRADFSIDDVVYQQGVICLSEHMMTFRRKRMMGKAFHHALELHLFSIVKMKTLSDYFIVILTDENEIKIYTPEGIRLARTILRDYLLSSSLIPPSRRFEFKPHDGNLFPPFNPAISPSQAFQFTYNAFCSYLDCSYQHEVVRFYHKNLTRNTGIINLNQLPIQLMETNIRLSMDLSPFFNALKYCSYIFGICCTNITHPDLFEAIAPLIEINCNLHILSIENCNIASGVGELAQAIANNPDIKISYFDLSGNPFADATPLMGVFAAYPHDVFFLDFGNCNLSSSATEMLMNAIRSNEHLWKLGYFHIPYAKINDKSAQIFKDHLRSLSQNGIHSLHSIDFGGIQSGVHHILEGLVAYPQPVDTLRINDSKIKPNSFNALISLIRNSDFLSELNISGSSLKIEQIVQIIKTIQENRSMKKFTLYIGGLKINGPNLETVLNQMKKTATIWVGLGLENNGLEVADVELLNRKLPKFTNLSKLELADNFHHLQKGIGDALAKLSELESLKYLGIKGCKSNGMETEIIPILRSLRSNTKITTLDISFNYSRQEGLEAIAELIRKNNSIKQLFIDGNRPKTIDPIIDVMDAIKLNNTILNCPIPNDDIYKAIAKKKSKERARLEYVIAQHQNDDYIKLLTNQVNNNVTSFMNLKNVPELDAMIEELTGQLAEELQSLQLTMHSANCELIGLNLPFKAETDHDQNGGTVVDVDTEAADTYGTKEAKRQVIEQVSEDVSNLQMLYTKTIKTV